MISSLVIAVVLLGTTNGHSCPACHETCQEEGVFSCEPCICNSKCSADFCSEPSKECVLVEFKCYLPRCPKLPTCIDVNKTCNGSPLRVSNGPAVLCSEGAHECPKDYQCSKVSSYPLSVCCKEDIKVEKPEEENLKWSWPVDPGSFIPDIEPVDPGKPSDKPGGDDDCEECIQDACLFLSCPNYPEAVCVTDDCSCSSYFMDANQEKVYCEIPPVFDLSSTTAAKIVSLESSDDGDSESSKVIMQQVIIASCVVFLFIVILLITCKVIHWKRKSMFRKQQEEQLKPLRVGNNNKMDIA